MAWSWSTSSPRRRLLVAILVGAGLVMASTALAARLRSGAEPARDLPGQAQDFRFAAPGSGVVSRLSVYLDRANTAASVELGIYSGSRSSAGARLARCAIHAPRPAAWNRCSIRKVRVQKGATFWLAVIHPRGSNGTLRYRTTGGSGASYVSLSPALESLPRSWRNGPNRSPRHASILADAPETVAGAHHSVTPRSGLIPSPWCDVSVSGLPALDATVESPANDGKTICVTSGGNSGSPQQWSVRHATMTRVLAVPADGSVSIPGITFAGASNITVEGFHITGGSSLLNSASHIRLVRNVMRDMSSDVLDIHEAASDIWFVGNVVHNIRYTGEAFTGYGIQTFDGPTNGLHVDYNTFDMGGNSADGLQLGDVHDFEILGNVIKHVGWAGTSGTDPHADAIMLWEGASHGLVKDNRITDSTGTLWSGSTSDVRVENNLIARMHGWCFYGGPTGSSHEGLVRYTWVRNTIEDCGNDWDGGGPGGSYGLLSYGPAVAGRSNTFSRNLLTSLSTESASTAAGGHDLVANGDRPGATDRAFTPRFADRVDYRPTNLPAGYKDVGYRAAPAGHAAAGGG